MGRTRSATVVGCRGDTALCSSSAREGATGSTPVPDRRHQRRICRQPSDRRRAQGRTQGARHRGYTGRHIRHPVHRREAGRHAAAAEALVRAGVDLIFTSQEAATLAAKEATKSVPIVFTLVGDPVGAGIVSKLAQPGGNVTGISSLQTELAAKRLSGDDVKAFEAGATPMSPSPSFRASCWRRSANIWRHQRRGPRESTAADPDRG
jgi:ABC transporter substrate binding protein